jgi:plastocyanin
MQRFVGVTLLIVAMGVLAGCPSAGQAPAAPPAQTAEATEAVTPAEEITPTVEIAPAETLTPTEEITPTEGVTPAEEITPTEGVTGTEGMTGAEGVTGTQGAAETGAVAPVQVELIAYEIRMPDTLPAGPTEFVVTNIDTEQEHNFEIEGQGLEQEFEEDLQPGESQTMQVDLQPGEYTIYCPVGDHEQQGMELTLTVTAP